MGKEDYDIIVKLVQEELNRMKITEVRSATVVSYSAPNAEVLLAGSSSSITIPNLTTITLVSDDIVEVVIRNGDLSDAWVGWKR